MLSPSRLSNTMWGSAVRPVTTAGRRVCDANCQHMPDGQRPVESCSSCMVSQGRAIVQARKHWGGICFQLSPFAWAGKQWPRAEQRANAAQIANSLTGWLATLHQYDSPSTISGRPPRAERSSSKSCVLFANPNLLEQGVAQTGNLNAFSTCAGHDFVADK